MLAQQLLKEFHEVAKKIKDKLRKMSIREFAEEKISLFKIFPLRLIEASKFFKNDFDLEFSKLENTTKKRVFILKLLSGLSSFGLGYVYSNKFSNQMVLKGFQKLLVYVASRWKDHVLENSRDWPKLANLYHDSDNDHVQKIISSFKHYLMTGKRV
ncbi:MAG: hypothetical protein AB7I27_04825 [Bacteriovoracaceae bacterium]